jgi:N-acyl-L-homoserine lactone synthetase
MPMVPFIPHPQDWRRDVRLRAMFAARKEVFVDLLGWDVPVVAGRFERDQFDTEDAGYLVLTDQAGGHLGSARLLATTRPHLLDSCFSALCDAPPPAGPTVFEISRFLLDRRIGAGGRRLVRDRLVGALVDHALARGITAYTGVAEPGWLGQILGFGWDCRPLGALAAVGGRTLGALHIHITRETPALLAAGIHADGVEVRDAA